MSYEKFDGKPDPEKVDFIGNQPLQDCPPNYSNNPPFPEDYLLLSLFTFLCCCTPLGLYAVIRGSHVKVLHAGGFYRQAADTSRVVRLTNLVGIVLGTLLQLVMGTMMLVYMLVVFKTVREMRTDTRTYYTTSPRTPMSLP